MTLESTTSKAVYTGNGATTEFPFSFKVWEEAQILVSVTDAQGYVQETGEYSVTLSAGGGTVSYLHAGAPLPSGWKLAITRDMPFTQEDDYITGTRFDPEVIETGLDRATAERQQLLDQLQRAVILPPTSDETPEDMAQELLKARDEAVKSAGAAKNSEQAAADSASDAAASEQAAAESVRQAEDWTERAQAWAESPIPPDPDDPESKSAKEWAKIASDTVPIATPALAGKVKPQTGAEDGLELGPDGTLRLRVASPTVRGGVKASETSQAYTVPHSRKDGTISPDWLTGVLKTVGGKIDGEILFGNGCAIRRDTDNGALIISGGTGYDSTDGMIVLHGKSDPSPGLAGLVELMAEGARVSVGVNGIYYPNDHRVMFNKDIFIQAVSPNGPVYRIPDGGTWNFTRLQWGIDGNIAEVSTQTVAGGIEANISNENAQFLIAYRVSM